MSTRVEAISKVELFNTRILVGKLIESGVLEWRRHGIGCLQGYVREGDSDEMRVHIWAPELVLPGIDVSGDVHNHRFTLRSTVLLGAIRHDVYHLYPDMTGDHETYDFVHARLHTDENRADMRPTGDRFNVAIDPWRLVAGQRYTFERGLFHRSGVECLAVTLCTKHDQRDERAMVLAPRAREPVPAFSGDQLDPELIGHLLEQAAGGLFRAATSKVNGGDDGQA